VPSADLSHLTALNKLNNKLSIHSLTLKGLNAHLLTYNVHFTSMLTMVFFKAEMAVYYVH